VPSLRVADVMSKDVERVAPHTSLEEVACCMRETPYSCVVVCDEDVPVGVITDHDVARLLAETLAYGPSSPMPPGRSCQIGPYRTSSPRCSSWAPRGRSPRCPRR